MNPYTAVRRIFVVLAHALKWLSPLVLLFLLGVIGVALTGGWWGWFFGPVLFVAVLGLVAVSIQVGIRLPRWWARKERLYREAQQTAHGESNPVTN